MITDEKTKATNSSLWSKGYLNGNEQFIDVLSYFILFFQKQFAPLLNKDLQLEYILKNQTPEFLLCKKYLGDNDNIPYFLNQMKYTIIYNFYENIKFIYDTIDKKFWQKIKIDNEMDLNNEDDLEIIFDFARKLAWCNIGEFSVSYIFNNYADSIRIMKKSNKNKDLAEIWNIMKVQYTLQFNIVFRNYVKKIRIVKKLI